MRGLKPIPKSTDEIITPESNEETTVEGEGQSMSDFEKAVIAKKSGPDVSEFEAAIKKKKEEEEEEDSGTGVDLSKLGLPSTALIDIPPIPIGTTATGELILPTEEEQEEAVRRLGTPEQKATGIVADEYPGLFATEEEVYETQIIGATYDVPEEVIDRSIAIANIQELHNKGRTYKQTTFDDVGINLANFELPTDAAVRELMIAEKMEDSKSFLTETQQEVVDLNAKISGLIKEKKYGEVAKIRSQIKSLMRNKTELYNQVTGEMVKSEDASQEIIDWNEEADREANRLAVEYEDNAEGLAQFHDDSYYQYKYAEEEFNKRQFELIPVASSKFGRLYSADELTSSMKRGPFPDTENHKKAQAIKRIFDDSRDRFEVVNRAYLLNEDPASIDKSNIAIALEAFGEEAFSYLGLDIKTDLDQIQGYVKHMQEAGFDLTAEQRENATLTMVEQTFQTIGSSAAVGAKLAAIILLTEGTGIMPMIEGALGRAIAAEVGKKGLYMFNLLRRPIKSAIQFELAPGESTTALMGAGEEISTMILEKLFGRFKPLVRFISKSGKVIDFTSKTSIRSAAEFINEYSGEYLQQLSDAGFDPKEAFFETFGRDMKSAIDKAWLTAITSLAMVGPANLARAKWSLAGMEQQDNITAEEQELIDDLKTQIADRKTVAKRVDLEQELEEAKSQEKTIQEELKQDLPPEEKAATQTALEEVQTTITELETKTEEDAIQKPSLEETQDKIGVSEDQVKTLKVLEAELQNKLDTEYMSPEDYRAAKNRLSAIRESLSGLEKKVTQLKTEEDAIQKRSAEEVDEIMFHGTNEDFDTFKIDEDSDLNAIWLTTSEKVARGFGKNIKEVKIPKGNYFDYKNESDIDKIVEASGNKSLESYRDEYKTGNWWFFEKTLGKDFTEVFKKAGFEGAYMKESGERGLAIFDPEKINKKTEEDAIQKQKTGGLDVREQARTGEGVRVQDTKGGKVTRKGKPTLEEEIKEAIEPKQKVRAEQVLADLEQPAIADLEQKQQTLNSRLTEATLAPEEKVTIQEEIDKIQSQIEELQAKETQAKEVRQLKDIQKEQQQIQKTLTREQNIQTDLEEKIAQEGITEQQRKSFEQDLETTKSNISELEARNESIQEELDVAASVGIQETIGEEAPKFVRMREKTVLQNKLRDLKKGARLGKAEVKQTAREIVKATKRYINKHLPLAGVRRIAMQKILTQLQEAGTDPKALENVIEIVDQLEAEGRVNKAVKSIEKDIDPSKYKTSKSGRKTGKIVPASTIKKINEINEVIRKPGREEALLKAEKIEQTAEKEGRELTDEEIDQVELYGLTGLLHRPEIGRTKKGGIERGPIEGTPDELEEAEQAIKDIISKGRTERKKAAERRRLIYEHMQANAIDDVTAGKGIVPALDATDLHRRKGFMGRVSDSIANGLNSNESWEFLLNELSRGKSDTFLNTKLNRMAGRPINNARMKEKAGIRVKFNELIDKRLEIYDSPRKAQKALNNNSEVKEVPGLKDSKGKPIFLSQNQAYYLYNLNFDETMHPTFEKMGFTTEMFDAIEEYLEPETKAWADYLRTEFFPKYHPEINEVYRELNGIDLSFIPNYTPEIRKGAENEAITMKPGEKRFTRSSISPGSIKERVANTSPIKLDTDGDSVLYQYISEMERYKAFAKPLRNLSAIFNNRDVKTAIEQNSSKNANQLIQNFMDDFARGGVDRGLSIRWVDKLRGNFSTANIGLNPVVALKQLTSIPAYMVDIPFGSYLKGMAEWAQNPIANTKFLLETEYMKDRIASGFDRDQAIAMARDYKKSFAGASTLASKLMFLTRWGDVGAIVFGGYPVYSYHYNKAISEGKSKPDAEAIGIEEFTNSTRRSQQSANMEDLSDFQRMGSLGNLFTMFKTSPMQYWRHERAALRNIARGKGSVASNLKRFAMYHFVLPSIFQYVASGMPGLDDWDEEDTKDMIRANMLGSLNGLFAAGDVLSYLGNVAIGKPFEYQVTPAFDDIGKLIEALGKALNKLTEGEASYEEYLSELHDIIEFAAKSGGLPFGAAERLGTNWWGYLMEGDEANIRRLIGFSDYVTGSPSKQGEINRSGGGITRKTKITRGEETLTR